MDEADLHPAGNQGGLSVDDRLEERKRRLLGLRLLGLGLLGLGLSGLLGLTRTTCRCRLWRPRDLSCLRIGVAGAGLAFGEIAIVGSDGMRVDA